MREANRQYAYFSLHGSFEPDDITVRTAVEPTDQWRKGDFHPVRRFERKASHWALQSRLPETEPIEQHIADVLEQLDRNPDAFAEVSLQHGGCMQLVGYFHNGYPGLHFDRSICEGLAKYHLSVDFDLYDLWSDAREDT